MIQILDGNLRDRGWPYVERRKNGKPLIYYLHVSLLHTKVVIITGRKYQRVITMGKRKGRRGVFQLAPRPARRARIAEQAWGADFSCEFLKLIRKRYVASNRCDVGPPLGSCSD